MGLSRELKNMTVWVDGDNYLGRIKEFEEPKLAIVTEDVRNGGMLGVVPVDRGLDKLTATLTAAGLEDALTSYFGITDIGGVPLRLVGAYQGDDGDKPDSVEIYCNGRWTEIDHGKATTKSDTEHKYTGSLVYYRRVVNGITSVEIDMLNGVFKVGGVDRYAEIMDILTS
jgi:P2 family phage contractile tail tube protein